MVARASAACSTASRADGYERRRPEESLLYQLVEQHWPTFRERAEQAGGLPKFVVDEFEAYLRCGILEHGFAHFACRRCGLSTVAAWSCKARGWCPSCVGRRMSDCAAHLVDEVLPEAPMRQWVCSLPWQLRCAMGYDAKLCTAVLAEFMRALRRSLRQRAKLALGLRSVEDAKFGAVTFIQRSDSSLRLNVHFHCLALDGVYVRDAAGQLCFHALPRPTASEVAEVSRWTYEGITRALARRGRSLDGFDDTVDEFADEQPALASCYSASVSDRQLLGAAPGEQTRKLVHPVRELSSPDEALAEVGGVNVHVGPVIDGRDRKRLERVCRYMTRPPVCRERLEVSKSGQVVYRFKRAWRSGAHAVVLAPLDFIARLAAMIPPPHFNLTRYHGVFAARAKDRCQVVPGPVPVEPEPVQLQLVLEPELLPEKVEARPASRHPWAWLLRRVFSADVMTCPSCRGAMRLVKIANTPNDEGRYCPQLWQGRASAR